MVGDENDTRFSLLYTPIGKWVVRIGLIAVAIGAILKYFGIID